MRILLDNCVNHRFGPLLIGFDVTHSERIGWANLSNGNLVQAAEEAGFDVLITVDKNLRYQQNLRGRHISIITLNVLLITYAYIAPLAPQVLPAPEDIRPGSFLNISREA